MTAGWSTRRDRHGVEWFDEHDGRGWYRWLPGFDEDHSQRMYGEPEWPTKT